MDKSATDEAINRVKKAQVLFGKFKQPIMDFRSICINFPIMVSNYLHYQTRPWSRTICITKPDLGREPFALPNPTLVANHLHYQTRPWSRTICITKPDLGREPRASINRSLKLIMPQQTPERLWSLPFASPL
jgi:hypothetical protein